MKIVLATANAHKLREIQGLLAGTNLEAVSLREFPGITLPEETGATMRDNARLKAQHCARESGLIALADDSGIEVDFIDGKPGVHSARWVEGSDEDRTRALLEKLQIAPDDERGARYRCAICLAYPDGEVLETEATCEGKIGYDFKGKNGFGYDPVFILTPQTGAPAEYSGQTMAQVPPEIKAQVSHRARAVRLLRQLFNDKE